MKSVVLGALALVLLAACEPAPQEVACSDCEKMAMEANAAHKAKMAAAKKDSCECCKGSKHHH